MLFHGSSPSYERRPNRCTGSKFRHRPAIPERWPLDAQLEEPFKSDAGNRPVSAHLPPHVFSSHFGFSAAVEILR
jgi:hypothetical protein